MEAWPEFVREEESAPIPNQSELTGWETVVFEVEEIADETP